MSKSILCLNRQRFTRTDEPSIHDVIDLAGARDRATTKLVFSWRTEMLVEPIGIEPTTSSLQS